MSFDIFPKYGQNFILKIQIQKICLLTYCWQEIMAWNYKFWKISELWTWISPLAISCTYVTMNFLKVFWVYLHSMEKQLCVSNGLGLSSGPKTDFVPNTPLQITHNGVGLRSAIRSVFLASSNIVLKVFQEKNYVMRLQET